MAKEEIKKVVFGLEDDFSFHDVVDNMVKEYRDGYFLSTDMEMGELFFCGEADSKVYFGEHPLDDILLACESAQSLSGDDFKTLIDVFCAFLYRKVMVLEMANNRADYESRDRERREYYGSSASAFWRLLEKYLDDFGYYRPFSSFADEYLEVGTYTW